MPRPKLKPEQFTTPAGAKLYELKPGEKMGRITVSPLGTEVRCLVPGCGFWISVPIAPRSVMEREVKDYYSDHRRHRHAEYVGRTLYEFVLSPDWPRQGVEQPQSQGDAADAAGRPSRG
jgi:hypothetical protein